MRVRRAAFTDEAALGVIRRDAILGLTASALSPGEAEKWANQIAPTRITRALQEHDVWVAVEEVAIAWVEVELDVTAALYVSPRQARRGVGSLLLEVAETFIHQSGYDAARLAASANALDFYLRRGYHRCGLPDAAGALPLRKQLMA